MRRLSMVRNLKNLTIPHFNAYKYKYSGWPESLYYCVWIPLFRVPFCPTFCNCTYCAPPILRATFLIPLISHYFWSNSIEHSIEFNWIQLNSIRWTFNWTFNPLNAVFDWITTFNWTFNWTFNPLNVQWIEFNSNSRCLRLNSMDWIQLNVFQIYKFIK